MTKDLASGEWFGDFPENHNGVRYKPIEGFPAYMVGSDGSVWTCWSRGGKHRLGNRWRRRKPVPVKTGHLSVVLCRDGERCNRSVHRLVLEAFVGPCPEGMEACHDPDRDPANNRLENLRWDTKSANQLDSVRHGTANVLRNPPKAKGEAHGKSVLTQDLVKRIIDLHRLEGIGKREICRRLGVPTSTASTIQGVIQGRTWNHITGLPVRGRTQT